MVDEIFNRFLYVDIIFGIYNFYKFLEYLNRVRIEGV